ncbi:hypothetical protein QFZ62_000710 [Clavibacter sp. B3I6]|uniref:hypothetical protein n=1 Tax=Clavibacter sp. B3I6 TaxID=3042268 RepID=UPI00277D4DBA|nr:hypothetical protein [Clavibacter sp. B3I6]MDQ0743402.1 hypothetical protein [Clavibacter sp. B3I6]
MTAQPADLSVPDLDGWDAPWREDAADDTAPELLPIEGEPGLFVALFADGSYFRCRPMIVDGVQQLTAA